MVPLGLLAIGSGGLAAVMAYSDDSGIAIVYAGLTALLVLILAGGLTTLRVRRRPIGAITEHLIGVADHGVRIPYSAWWYGWVVMLLTALVLGFGAAVLAVVLAWDLGVPPARLVGLAVIGVLAVPVCGWLLLDAARGRVARGHVVLTAQGVHHRGLTYEEFVPWAAVQLVVADHHRQRGPAIRVLVQADRREWRRTGRVDPRRKPQLPEVLDFYGRVFAVDPAVLYHALRFYHAHPEARAELATPAGVRRIREGGLR